MCTGSIMRINCCHSAICHSVDIRNNNRTPEQKYNDLTSNVTRRVDALKKKLFFVKTKIINKSVVKSIIHTIIIETNMPSTNALDQRHHFLIVLT